MDLATQKKEIIKWINSVENPLIIEQIKNIQQRDCSKMNFENEWKDALSITEAREKSIDFIKNLPWKK